MARTLLITDDAPIMRAMIKDAAVEASWEVVGEASNGEIAVNLYRELRPDMVTMDLVMPEFDGIHGVREIVKFDSHAKVVVISAVNQRERLKEAFAAGAADFLCKPFERQRLVQLLQSASA